MLAILGQGYVGDRLAHRARAEGRDVVGVRRQAGHGVLAFDDPCVKGVLAKARHVVASVAPDAHGDPVLAAHAAELAHVPWVAYLSSTGVYGNTEGAWVDESSPVVGDGAGGRRMARAEADRRWRALGACVIRLPGIYGPGRSVFDQLRHGTARRIDRSGHRFSRVHVDDIVGGLLAAMRGEMRGVYNLADELPAEPRTVTEEACRLAGMAPPPVTRLADAGLSPAAMGFWSEKRLVSGGKFLRESGYGLRYPDYKEGLRAIWATERSVGWHIGC